MTDITATPLVSLAVRAFVPARDHALSRRFYAAIGFAERWATPELALFEHGSTSFLLQNFHVPACTDNFMMQLVVADVDAWWRRIAPVAVAFGVRIDDPQDQPWGLRDFPLFDPSGVLWRVSQAAPD
jgi:hypothetical protein